MEDRIAKEKLNIILLVDTSKSMAGERISQVNQAVNDIQIYLKDLQAENSNVDFYLSLISFSTGGKFYNNSREDNVENLTFNGFKTGGWSNLEAGYQRLEEVMPRQSKGGIMSDFGGVTPIIILLTDGHPTTNKYKDELAKLKQMPWFKVALRYGIAIGLNDNTTKAVLADFVEDHGEVIDCYRNDILKNIIKIIVLTASKVKSTSSQVSYSPKVEGDNKQVQQLISEALMDVSNWEW